MSQITSHVLDTSRGKPVKDLPITLYRLDDSSWQLMTRATTNVQGRVSDLLYARAPSATGCYRLNFETGTYFDNLGESTFFPYVDIVFNIDNAVQHYHVPLLLSAYGYSTYRGS